MCEVQRQIRYDSESPFSVMRSFEPLLEDMGALKINIWFILETDAENLRLPFLAHKSERITPRVKS